MGRKAKIVISANDLDRRESGYYSTPQFVAQFVADRILELKPNAHCVLDPCIGRGEFTTPFKAAGCHVRGYDVIDMAPEGCDDFLEADFLRVVMDDNPLSLFGSSIRPKVDVIVATPPYNCHEVEYIRTHKAQLASRFGKAAALNMYALFIRAILEWAPDGCFIGLVTHDSFLTATGHEELRRYIIDNCKIHNLHLCPTNLFLDQGADVRTCLLILEKTKNRTGSIMVSNRPSGSREFPSILRSKTFQRRDLSDILLTSARDGSEFAIGVPAEIHQLFKDRRLSDVAPCVTGISTGNDQKYIRKIRSSAFDMPFYKNPASRQFYAEPDGYLCTDYEQVGREVSNFMIRNKTLIFRGGISCSSMGVKFSAALRPENSACGVNPNLIVSGNERWWLLAFLNSRLCLYMTRGVIIRSNMITAGYAARIPVPKFGATTIHHLVELGEHGFMAAREGRAVKPITNEIDETVENALNLSVETINLLADFERDPTRLT